MFKSIEARSIKKPRVILMPVILLASLLLSTSCVGYGCQGNACSNNVDGDINSVGDRNVQLPTKTVYHPYMDIGEIKTRENRYILSGSSEGRTTTASASNKLIGDGNNCSHNFDRCLHCGFYNGVEDLSCFKYLTNETSSQVKNVLDSDGLAGKNGGAGRSMSISDFISLAGFFGALFNFYLIRYMELLKVGDSYKRDFWLKQVLFPSYIDNLKKVIIHARDYYDGSRGNSVEIANGLLPYMNKIKDESIFFNSYDNCFKGKIEDLVDVFDDELAAYANGNNNTVDAEYLFSKLQVLTDNIFSMLDSIYGSEETKISMFSVETIKRVFFCGGECK